MKHTPGPWKTKCYTGFIKVVGPSLKISACLLACDMTPIDRDQHIADAHLIAAAPELLDALEDCVGELEHLVRYGGDCEYGIPDTEIIAAAKAAIAKAKGEDR